MPNSDNPRPDPPFQQTPDRGPVDPHHEPAKGDGEPGEAPDVEDEDERTSDETAKKIAKQKTVE
jgi:hypothetical protein